MGVEREREREFRYVFCMAVYRFVWVNVLVCTDPYLVDLGRQRTWWLKFITACKHFSTLGSSFFVLLFLSFSILFCVSVTGRKQRKNKGG